MMTLNGRPITQIFAYLSEPTYENFMFFVKTFLKPHMSSVFIEEEYYKTLWDDMWGNGHCLMQLPRGHSKTEMVGVWMTIYLAVCQPINKFNPNKTEIKEQMILAGDGTAKHTWAERIKHFFYECPFLSWLIPDGADSKKQNVYWNDRVMYFKNGSIIKIRAIGEKGIRGNHVDRLHADDLVTENSALVDLDIKEKWDGAVDGTTTNKKAMVQVTGTPLRFTDILFHLKGRGYYFRRLPAIIDYDKKIILSPNRWSWENLMDTKTRIGTVRFQCEYMLDPIDDSTSLIKQEWVRQCFDTSEDVYRQRPDFVKAVYLGVDFAFSDRITADRSAFVILGEIERMDTLTNMKTKKYIIMDIITKRGMSAMEQFQFIKELNTTYRFDLIGVEENSIKGISKEISKFNLPIKRYWTAASDSKNEADIRKEYETIGKRNLILRLGTAFEQRQIIVPYKSEEAKKKAEEMLNECISFAQEEGVVVEIGVHPDIPIALGYCFEVGARPRMISQFVNLGKDVKGGIH